MAETKAALGIGWGINSITGWGVLGLNIMLQLLAGQKYLPVPFLRPKLNGLGDDQRAALDPALRAYDNLKRQTAGMGSGHRWRTDMPAIFGLVGDFIGYEAGSGTENHAIIFIASDDFTEAGKERARRYDRIVAGCAFCARLVESAGVTPVGVWHQGIDTSIFKPAKVERELRNRFVIYSGGKLEYRKGQDMVIAAYRAFHSRHPDSLLICHWPTQHPVLAEDFAQSPLLRSSPSEEEARSGEVSQWLIREGLPENSFRVMKFMGNNSVPMIIRQSDAALFPSRAEPGTNLVAMEAAACGVPVILSNNTGHKDLIAAVPSYVLSHQSPVTIKVHGGTHPDWGDSSVDEIVERLEEVYSGRDRAKQIGIEGAAAMEDFAWQKQVPRLLDLLEL